MLTLAISIIISVFVVLIFRFINRPHKPPLFGVYQQKNKYYWFKFVVLFVILTVRQWYWRLRRAYAVEAGKSGDGNIEVHTEDTAMEQKHDLGTYPQAVDASYFNGISKEGNAVLFAIARRQNNICDAQVSIRINGEEYFSPKLPDTYLEQDESDRGEFRVQGIQIEHFIPMRTWKLLYNGDMKPKSDPEKRVKVQAELTWSALFPPFNYDYQVSPRGVASDMAREPWSRDYFKTIEKFHLSHYEQMGSLKGTATIDGKEHALKMHSFRDRTFGKVCDWRSFHRYVFHTLYLENGDCIVVGVVSQPLVISHMTLGFLCHKCDPITYAVQDSDFKLYQHGENQVPPKDYGFTFKAGGTRYTVRVTVDDEYVSYSGQKREAKFHARWLSVSVNGVAGRGFSHWHYNNERDSHTRQS